ncbi:MAG: helix-turn-helix transcriptional regulator [Spirochaetales bacterium]|nr:helix-turn-helix transcriptional regulator [Spirochaetales bacterium]
MARQRDELKKELIMSSATKLFAEKGFHATSIQDIVSESGLSVGTIYLYFHNKEEIFITLLDSGVGAFIDELFNKITPGVSNVDLASQFGDTILEAIQSNLSVVTVLTNELSFQEQLHGFYSMISKAIADRFMGNNDEESLYKLLNMSKKEFFALVTILLSGLTNAIRLATVPKPIIKMKDINFVIQELVLKSLLMRIDLEQSISD